MTVIEPAFSADAAARRLTEAGYPVTADWIKKHLADVPHIRTGRKIRFTDTLLSEFLAQSTRRPVEPDDTLRPVSRRR